MSTEKIAKVLQNFTCPIRMMVFDSTRVNGLIYDSAEGVIYMTDDVKQAVKSITNGGKERKEDLIIYK